MIQETGPKGVPIMMGNPKRKDVWQARGNRPRRAQVGGLVRELPPSGSS